MGQKTEICHELKVYAHVSRENDPSQGLAEALSNFWSIKQGTKAMVSHGVYDNGIMHVF